MYTIVITWDCGEPDVYGPFSNEKEAEQYLEKLTSKWGDWEWGAQTGHGVRKMAK